jgi:signal transduction histidine kinase
MPVLTVMKVILVATIAIGVSGGLLAWRERPKPGSIPLAALLAAQSWWSAGLFFQITATGIGNKILWVNITWIGVAVIPVAWLFFSLEYTGYSQYVHRRYVALASIVPAVTVLIALTDNYHELLYTASTLVERNETLILERTPGPWFYVITGYTYLLGLFGAIPLLRFVTSDIDTFRGQSLSILVGLIAPWVTNGLFVAGVLPTAEIDPTPIAFSISGVAYLGALMYLRLFGTMPAAIRQARQTVFDRMQEGAIVLDSHDHVVDMNERAVSVVGTPPADVLGRSLARTLPNLADVTGAQSQSEQAVFRPEHGTGAYDVSVNPLSDTHGRTIGRILTLHDITDYLQQQQRLEVLNRVFRHNIRTNTQVIIGNAEYVADRDSDPEVEKVLENALEIKEISDKIRTVLSLFEQKRKPAVPVHLVKLLRERVRSVRAEHPEVTVTTDLGSDDIYVDSVLNEVFSNVIENAAEHNTHPDPEIWIDVDSTEESVRVVVEDNGPGIDEEELVLAEEGTEKPLEHGSGFGLAVIVWGTEIIGGTVSFESDDQSGLTVTVEVPVLSRSDRSHAEDASAYDIHPDTIH